jgi:capsular exopolysaccharide synthesis family protein
MIENRPPSRPQAFADEEQEGQSFPLLDYVQLLWFRRMLILSITIFVFVIGYIQVNEIRNIYTATSTLMVGLPEARVVDIESVLGRESDYHGAEDVIQVLRSRVLAAKVIKRLNLLSHLEFNPALSEPEESLFDFLEYLDPRSWIPSAWKKSWREALGHETETAPPPLVSSPEQRDQEAKERREQQLLSSATNVFLGKLNIVQVGNSNVIQISVSSLYPETAALIANDLPEAFIIDQLEASLEASEKANSWLTEQVADLQTKVAESERAVEIYRETHGLIEVSGLNILDTQLSELNSQLIIARAEKAEVDARLAQLRRLLRGGGQGIETASEVLSSSLVQQLRTQEAQALSRASELSVEYGPKHPRMLQVQAEIGEIRERIRTEIERIAVGLEHEAEFANTRVVSLQNSLRAAQGETSEQNKEAIQMRSLEREAAANRALYETFLNRFKETSSTQGLETPDARVLSRAEVPGGPSYPDRGRMLTNYILVGFFGACGLVLALQLLNPGMTNPEQVQQLLGEYVIGLIPFIPGSEALHDAVIKKPSSSVVEAINTLKFSLALSDPDHPVKTVQVTSSVPEEGKTTLAISLARVAAASGQKVIIVDGDLRRSSVGKKLGLLQKQKGLSDLVVAGDADMSEFIMRDEKGGMDYLSAGTAKYANATDIFSSHRMQTIIEMLKSRYDLVVVDAPPVMAVADARIMGRVVDKTIFVVHWDKTPRKVAKAAVEQMRRANISLAGVVLQQVDLKRYGRVGYGDSGYYYHYGRYGKYYSG